MADKDKVYQVLAGCKYTGKHGVYIGADEKTGKLVGDKFKGSELMGKEANIEMALKGQKDQKRKGRSLPDVKPVIKLVTASEAKKEAKKEADK